MLGVLECNCPFLGQERVDNAPASEQLHHRCIASQARSPALLVLCWHTPSHLVDDELLVQLFPRSGGADLALFAIR